VADDITAAPAVSGVQPAPPAPASAPPVTGDVTPGGEKPEGTLEPEVHAAVKAERTRAQQYRQTLEQLVTFDDQGQITGLRPEVVEHVAGQLRAEPAAPATDPEVAYQSRIRDWSAKLGFLPEQVEGVVTLAQAIAEQIVDERTGPMQDSSIDTIKANLIASDAVPKEAASFVAKWVDTARKINPRALLTSQGRETVLRQAVGEYYLRRARGVTTPAGGGGLTPSMLRPGAGPASGATPTLEEQEIRRKMGLSVSYTDQTPKQEGSV